MVRITEELLRKRSEHHDGLLTDLQEISLHQFNIEKIENLHICRKLRILLLQGNKISKIENLRKLKELRYLNLAINAITKIENLEGLESLEKLDLSVNYIHNLLDVEKLRANEFLKELYLLGNPCMDFEGYRSFVIATLPGLKYLEGREVEPEERAKALEELPKLRAELVEKAANLKEEDLPKRESLASTDELQQPTPARPPSPPKEDRVFRSDGSVLQKNEPGLSFKFDEDKVNVRLEVGISKFVDSSLVKVDVQPTYATITVKGKILRLALPEEIHPDKTKAERSSITGTMVLTMQKVKAIFEPPQPPKKREVFGAAPDDDQHPRAKSKAVDIRNIIKRDEPVDESEVPPLEDIQ